MKRTEQQNSQFHTLLSRLAIPAYLWKSTKAEWASQMSAGRTDKTSELTYEEMEKLISQLQQQVSKPVNTQETDDPADVRMRSKVYAIMHTIKWKVDGKLDYSRLSDWLKKYRDERRPHLSKYSGQELREIVLAFEKMEVSTSRKKSNQ